MPKIDWRNAKSDPPQKDGKYLVCRCCFDDHKFIDVSYYSTDLYRVNDYEFHDKKGVPGWYQLDSEYGDYVEDDVIYWFDPELP